MRLLLGMVVLLLNFVKSLLFLWSSHAHSFPVSVYNSRINQKLRYSMARILSITPSEVLRTTRQLVMEKEGHQVQSLGELAHSDSLALEEKFDLAVIGHGYRGDDKRRMANLINQHFPGLPILELCFQSPEIPGADFILTDSPDELLVAIKEILSGRRVRGFLH